MCRIEKVLDSLNLDSVIRMFAHGGELTTGTTGERFKNYLIGKLALEFKEVECKKGK